MLSNSQQMMSDHTCSYSTSIYKRGQGGGGQTAPPPGSALKMEGMEGGVESCRTQPMCINLPNNSNHNNDMIIWLQFLLNINQGNSFQGFKSIATNPHLKLQSYKDRSPTFLQLLKTSVRRREGGESFFFFFLISKRLSLVVIDFDRLEIFYSCIENVLPAKPVHTRISWSLIGRQ